VADEDCHTLLGNDKFCLALSLGQLRVKELLNEVPYTEVTTDSVRTSTHCIGCGSLSTRTRGQG
jgi:hypothetical protein